MYYIHAYVCPSIRIYSKHFSYVLSGLYEHGLKCIFVSRLDSDSRRRCNEEIMRRVSSDEEWPPLLIFPEGLY